MRGSTFALLLLATAIAAGEAAPAMRPLDEAEIAARDRMQAELRVLCVDIGERNLRTPEAYAKAAAWIADRMRAAGLAPRREEYRVGDATCANIVAEVAGASSELVVVGAHYDTVRGCPGANDNGSGVVALLELAQRFAAAGAPRPARTLRLVAFANEEPPHFQTDTMGSRVHARAAAARGERIAGMISLETIGCFSDAEGSQKFPLPALAKLYPTTGNFIAFVGEPRAAQLIAASRERFAAACDFPVQAAALPEGLPGVGWSDHWSFSREGHPAFMVTDTAPFRYEHYHEATDTVDHVDCGKIARLLTGVEAMVRGLLAAR